MKSRMYYTAIFNVPISVDVEVMEEDLMLDKAQPILRELAIKKLEKFGRELDIDFSQMEMAPNTFRGVAIDYLPEEERKKYDSKQLPNLGIQKPKLGTQIWCQVCGVGDHTTGQHVMAKIKESK